MGSLGHGIQRRRSLGDSVSVSNHVSVSVNCTDTAAHLPLISDHAAIMGHCHPKSARISGPFGAVDAGSQRAEPRVTERALAVRFNSVFDFLGIERLGISTDCSRHVCVVLKFRAQGLCDFLPMVALGGEGREFAFQCAGEVWANGVVTCGEGQLDCRVGAGGGCVHFCSWVNMYF